MSFGGVTLLPRVEILGLFGSGKTTLAKSLRSDTVTISEEKHELNPFWLSERKKNIAGNLPYDLWFLLQHFSQVAESVPGSKSNQLSLSDWSFATDHLWASMRLADDLACYEQVFQVLLSRIPPAIGYIHMDIPLDVVKSRMRQRGRSGEGELETHLEKANQKLTALVRAIPRHKLLAINEAPNVSKISKHILGWVHEDGK